MPEATENPDWRPPSWIADHIQKYLTDPDGAHMWDVAQPGAKGPVPTLLLTTTGRKSGEPRLAPLIYGRHGKAYVVIASKGGYPHDPVWYLNLVAHPEAEVRVGREQLRVRARTAKGAEREALWRMMCDVYPPYDEYQARASDREIPVVVLDPVG